MRARRYILIPVVSAFLVAIAGCSGSRTTGGTPTPLPVVKDLSGTTAEGRLEPARYVRLTAPVGGVVNEVLVSEGEQVQAGQLLARLDGDHAATLAEAQAQIALELGSAHEAVRAAQNALDGFDLPRIFEGMTAEEAARTWLAELDEANAVFEPFRDTSRTTLKSRDAFPNRVYPSLPERVLLDTGEYEGVAREYKKRVDVARTNYTKAIIWLQLESALSVEQARLADAQRRHDDLHAETTSESAAGTLAGLATAEIRAPFDGTVATLDLRVGETAVPGVPLLTLADFSSWLVKTTDLTEIDVVGIREGMTVAVVLDADPGVKYGGTVKSIDLHYTDVQGDVIFPVAIQLLESDPVMRWGMTVEVTFEE